LVQDLFAVGDKKQPGPPVAAGQAVIFIIQRGNYPEASRLPRASGSRAKRYARQAREGVCRAAGVRAMRGENFSRNFPAMVLPVPVAATIRFLKHLRGQVSEKRKVIKIS